MKEKRGTLINKSKGVSQFEKILLSIIMGKFSLRTYCADSYASNRGQQTAVNLGFLKRLRSSRLPESPFQVVTFQNLKMYNDSTDSIIPENGYFTKRN